MKKSNPLLQVLDDVSRNVRRVKRWPEDEEGIAVTLSEAELRGADVVLAELRKCFAPDMEAVREAAIHLYEVCPGFKPQTPPETADEEVDDTSWRFTPFFSEAYLYRLMGKEEGRTVLCLVQNLLRAVGFSAVHELETQGHSRAYAREKEAREKDARRLAAQQRRSARASAEVNGKALVTRDSNLQRLRIPEGLRKEGESFPISRVTNPIPAFAFVPVGEPSAARVGLVMEEGVGLDLILSLAMVLENQFAPPYLWETAQVPLLEDAATKFLRGCVSSGELVRSTDPKWWSFSS